MDPQNIQRMFITFENDDHHQNGHADHHGRGDDRRRQEQHRRQQHHDLSGDESKEETTVRPGNVVVPLISYPPMPSLLETSAPTSSKKRKKSPVTTTNKGRGTKSIPSSLISDDETQHSVDGEFILKSFLIAAKNKGYSESIGYGKLGSFVKEFQMNAFGSGHVLSGFSPNSVPVFQSKLSDAMKLLEKHKMHAHSPSEDVHGEDIPIHLRSLVSLYSQVLQTSDCESSSKNRIPAENVANARKFMTFMPPANGDSERDATRIDNAKAGKALAPLDTSKGIVAKRMSQPVLKDESNHDSDKLLIDLLTKQIEERKKKNEERAGYTKMKFTIDTLKQTVKIANDQVQYWEMKVFECGDDEAKEKKAMYFLEKKQSELNEAKAALKDALAQI